ncbi:adenosine receptor A3-like [Clytia hemisphaerica]|uniref:adenosine receptor A3-like n=1 Tax=Clytia hemisphaerica TaxID=252671 RepID=UPI0034D42BD8
MVFKTGLCSLLYLILSKALEIAALCFISITVIIVNLLVILAYFKGSRRLRTKTNLFIINLAIADLLVGALSIPVWVMSLLNFITHEHVIYEYLVGLDVLFGTTSILSLTAISIERMLAVKFALMHRNLNNLPFYIIISIVWGIGIVTAGLRLFWEDKKYYTLFVFLVAFIFPAIVIVFSYSIIVYTAVQFRRFSSNRMNRDIQIAKKILIIIGLFLIFWLPFFALNMCYYFGTPYLVTKIESSTGLVSIAKIMHYINSMMNFFLYALRVPDFHGSIKTLLFNCCGKKRIQHQTLTHSHMLLPQSLNPWKTKQPSRTRKNTQLRFLLNRKEDECFEKLFINDYVGFGIFTKFPIGKQDVILEYKGELVSIEEADERRINYERDGHGCFIYDGVSDIDGKLRW